MIDDKNSSDLPEEQKASMKLRQLVQDAENILDITSTAKMLIKELNECKHEEFVKFVQECIANGDIESLNIYG